jgi:hypothetical protein
MYFYDFKSVFSRGCLLTIPISMSSPVTQTKTSIKISVSAPVTWEKSGGRFLITFLMRSEFSMEILPGPLDPNIAPREIPARLMAASQYTGTWRRSLDEGKKTLFDEWIKERGYIPGGSHIRARYNPPYTSWFMRQNEIRMPVETEK